MSAGVGIGVGEFGLNMFAARLIASMIQAEMVGVVMAQGMSVKVLRLEG